MATTFPVALVEGSSVKQMAATATVASAYSAVAARYTVEDYQTMGDRTNSSSDSENENDIGWDSERASSSRTRSSTPDTGSDCYSDHNGSIYQECFEGWSEFHCTPPKADCALCSQDPYLRLSSLESTDDYFENNASDPGPDDNAQTISLDEKKIPPVQTPMTDTLNTTIEETIFTTAHTPVANQSLSSIELESLHSRPTSIVNPAEVTDTPNSVAPQNSPIPFSASSETEAEPAISPVSRTSIEQRSPSTSTERNPELESPSPHPPTTPTSRPSLCQETSIHALSTFYTLPSIPQLHYIHSPPSRLSTAAKKLTNKIHRIRARKRSVKESAAMEHELRAVHAKMRESEIRMRERDQQPPQYVDVLKDVVPRHGEREFGSTEAR